MDRQRSTWIASGFGDDGVAPGRRGHRAGDAGRRRRPRRRPQQLARCAAGCPIRPGCRWPAAERRLRPRPRRTSSRPAWSAHRPSCSVRDAEPMLRWLADRLTEGDDQPVGRWLTVAAHLFGCDVDVDPRVGVGAWRWPDDGDVALVDAPHFDVERPWILDPGWNARRASTWSGIRSVSRSCGPRPRNCMGRRVRLHLPGGIPIDDSIRHLVASSPDCPAPWSEPVAFRTWLETRYWFELHARRRDLAVAFPEPIVARCAAVRRVVSQRVHVRRGAIPAASPADRCESRRDRPGRCAATG